MAEASGPVWMQKTITFNNLGGRGCYQVTQRIKDEIKQELSGFKFGLAHLFLQHSTASLTISEEKTDVGKDIENFLNRIVSEGSSAPLKHPAHIRSLMVGCALTIPISSGKLNMGTHQGIWLCQHRDRNGALSVVVTLNGMRC